MQAAPNFAVSELDLSLNPTPFRRERDHVGASLLQCYSLHRELRPRFEAGELK